MTSIHLKCGQKHFGAGSFNILVLFSTPLLVTFWPFFWTTIRALKFHLAGFISSITTSDLWEIEEKRHLPETLYIYKTMPANYIQLNPLSNIHSVAVTGDTDNEGCYRIKAYFPSVNAILNIPSVYPVNICNPIHVIYKLHTDIGY